MTNTFLQNLVPHYKLHFSSLSNIHRHSFKVQLFDNANCHLIYDISFIFLPLEGRVVIAIPSTTSLCVYATCFLYSLITLCSVLQLHETPRRETEVPCTLFGLEPQHHTAEERQVTRGHHGAGWYLEFTGKRSIMQSSMTRRLILSCPHLSVCSKPV